MNDGAQRTAWHARPRSVLAALDTHDDDAGAAVDAAGVLAAALGAEVILAGVAPLAAPAPEPDELSAALPPLPFDDQQAAIDRLTRSQVAEAALRLPADVPRRTVLCWGPTGPAIVDAVRREAADLVVVSMRRASAVGHLLHDGADRYLLHHSDVPVLVVPAERHDPWLDRTEAPADSHA
jgi:nucleotide-binding universal stress UspA family protein